MRTDSLSENPSKRQRTSGPAGVPPAVSFAPLPFTSGSSLRTAFDTERRAESDEAPSADSEASYGMSLPANSVRVNIQPAPLPDSTAMDRSSSRSDPLLNNFGNELSSRKRHTRSVQLPLLISIMLDVALQQNSVKMQKTVQVLAKAIMELKSTTEENNRLLKELLAEKGNEQTRQKMRRIATEYFDQDDSPLDLPVSVVEVSFFGVALL